MAETSPTPASNKAPVPPPPMPSAPAAAAAVRPAETEPVAKKPWPIALLGINFLLSLLIAIVVVLAASNIFIMPRMTLQNTDIQSLQRQINDLRARLDEATTAAEPPAADQPAAVAAPAADQPAAPAAPAADPKPAAPVPAK
jgi:hypothetical protein